MTSDEGFLSVDQLVGRTAYDQDGAKVGSVEQVYRDDATGRPEWVTVKTGLFGTKETFVPLEGASSDAQGLHLAHDKNTIKDAPNLDAEQHLDAGGERELYAHYGMTPGAGMAAGDAAMGGDGKQMSDTGAAAPGGMPDAEVRDDDAMAGGAAMSGGDVEGQAATGRAGAAVGGAGMDGAGMDGAEEMIRSEERLHVGTEEEETGRARLRKVVVTENVTTTIPVSHEEARLVREPIRPGDTVRPDFGDKFTEVTLHAEHPVVRKEAVAVERVRLEAEKVTEQQEVTDTVRKEQVEYDDGMDGKGPGRKGERKNPDR